MKFVDPKNDLAFKKIFGDNNKTEILISLLNALLNLPYDIVSITNMSPYQPPIIKVLKNSSLDIKAKDTTGREFVVEMQVEPNDNFGKRALYYLAKAFVNQIKIGEDYNELKPAYFLGFLNFNLFKGNDYVTNHIFINQSTGNQDLSFIELNFVELKKFHKKEEELDNIIDKWIFFMKNATDLDHVPKSTTDQALLDAYDSANQNQWSAIELEAYEYRVKKHWDKINEARTLENRHKDAERKLKEKVQKEKEKVQKEKRKAEVAENKAEVAENKAEVAENKAEVANKKAEEEREKNKELLKEIELLRANNANK